MEKNRNYEIYKEFIEKNRDFNIESDIGTYIMENIENSKVSQNLSYSNKLFSKIYVMDIDDVIKEKLEKFKSLLETDFGRLLLSQSLTKLHTVNRSTEERLLFRFLKKDDNIKIEYVILNKNNKLNLFHIFTTPEFETYDLNVQTSLMDYISFQLPELLNILNQFYGYNLTVNSQNRKSIILKNHNARKIKEIVRSILRTNNISCDYDDKQTQIFLSQGVYSESIYHAFWQREQYYREEMPDTPCNIEYKENEIVLTKNSPFGEYKPLRGIEGLSLFKDQIAYSIINIIKGISNSCSNYPSPIFKKSHKLNTSKIFNPVISDKDDKTDITRGYQVGLLKINQYEIANELTSKENLNQIYKFIDEVYILGLHLNKEVFSFIASLSEYIKNCECINENDISSIDISYYFNLHQDELENHQIDISFLTKRLNVGENYINYQIYLNNLFKSLIASISTSLDMLLTYLAVDIDFKKGILKFKPLPTLFDNKISDSLYDILTSIKESTTFYESEIGVFSNNKYQNPLISNKDIPLSYFMNGIYYLLYSKVYSKMIISDELNMLDHILVCYPELELTPDISKSSLKQLIGVIYSNPVKYAACYDKDHDGYDIIKLYNMHKSEIDEYLLFEVREALNTNIKTMSFSEMSDFLKDHKLKLILQFKIDNDDLSLFIKLKK